MRPSAKRRLTGKKDGPLEGDVDLNTTFTNIGVELGYSTGQKPHAVDDVSLESEKFTVIGHR